MHLPGIFALFSAVALLGACTGIHARDHIEAVDNSDGALTLGSVQQHIAKGTSAKDVARALGSPNIVTGDGEGREVWIYDKLSTLRATSESGSGVRIFGLIVFPYAEQSSSAAGVSQKTLTVIITLDEHDKVRDFSYRRSYF